MINTIRSLFVPPNYKQHKDYQDADSWYKEIDTTIIEVASTKWEYAQHKYEETKGVLDGLDAKAEGLFRFSAVLVGALIAMLSLTEDSIQLLPSLIPSLLAFGVSALIALIAKQTVTAATAMSIKHALELEGNENAVQARLSASTHCAFVASRIVGDWKAARCDWSARFMILGVALLACLLLRDFPRFSWF